MWLMAAPAWFSVVAYDPSKDPRVQQAAKDGKRIKPKVTSKYTHLLIRARVKEDLEALKSVVPSLVIFDDVVADYRFRAVISRAAFKQWAMKQIDEIDYYSHVKETFRDQIGQSQSVQAGQDRYSAAMKIWSAWHSLQPSNWDAKGKYGTTYYGAAAWDDEYSGYSSSGYSYKPRAKSPVQITNIGDIHEWSGLSNPRDFDAALNDAVTSYEEAAKTLGLAPPADRAIDLDGLKVMLSKSQDNSGRWYVDFTADDLEVMDDDAFMLAQALINMYGFGGELSEEEFDELHYQLFPGDQTETTQDIHSLPLDVDPTA